MPVLLKQRVDAGDAPVPGVLEVLQRQSAVLGVGLLALEPALIDTVGSRTQRRRLSDGRLDGVAAAWHRADAIDATSQVQVQNLRRVSTRTRPTLFENPQIPTPTAACSGTNWE